MKQGIFLILKLWKAFLKELVMGKGSFLAKCTRLVSFTQQKHMFDRKTLIKVYFVLLLVLIFCLGAGD